MEFVLVVMGGIALIVWTIILLDWFGRRRDRRSGHHPAA